MRRGKLAHKNATMSNQDSPHVLVSGTRGREFESHRPDHSFSTRKPLVVVMGLGYGVATGQALGRWMNLPLPSSTLSGN